MGLNDTVNALIYYYLKSEQGEEIQETPFQNLFSQTQGPVMQSRSSDQGDRDACLLSLLAHPGGPKAAAKQPPSAGSNTKTQIAHIRLSCCEEYGMRYSWHSKFYLKKHSF